MIGKMYSQKLVNMQTHTLCWLIVALFPTEKPYNYVWGIIHQVCGPLPAQGKDVA